MNHKITLEDPRLTTYALGELNDANDRRLVENALVLDPALRAYANEIQSLGLTLKEGFVGETTTSLADTDNAESTMAQPKAQKDALESLESEHLVQSATLLDNQNPTLQTLRWHFQEVAQERQSMLEQGLAESHSQMKETTAMLEQIQEMLLAATESVKATLDTKLQMANQSMTLARAPQEKDATMNEGKLADYRGANVQANVAGVVSGPKPPEALAAYGDADGTATSFVFDSSQFGGGFGSGQLGRESLPTLAQVAGKNLPLPKSRRSMDDWARGALSATAFSQT